jgi:antitoxin component YwqK of YwqJK toxin-antitoxin module
MKKLFQTLILCLLANSTFGQDTIYFDAKWKESNKLNSTFYRIQKKENDKWLRMDFFTENNQLQMKGYYSSINPDKEVGYFEWYFSNGKLKHKGDYEDGKAIGEHDWYSDNGKLDAIENYKSGKLDGVYKEYYKSGKLSLETLFSQGVQNGYTKYYREDGSLHSEGNFKDGDRNGVWKFYDENGKIISSNEFKTEYYFPEAKISMALPNSQWSLINKDSGKITSYVFKREEVEDDKGRKIIPAITLVIEDAGKYNQDAVLYSSWKEKPFIERGVKIDEIATWESKNYKISIKNLLLYKCHYTEKDFDHLFYMIHMISKENKGVQIYLDMTMDIAEKYEAEFLKTINSLEEK